MSKRFPRTDDSTGYYQPRCRKCGWMGEKYYFSDPAHSDEQFEAARGEAWTHFNSDRLRSHYVTFADRYFDL